MKKRVRFRCLDVQGDGFRMRVQTVEGNISPETMKALQGIGRAAAAMLKAAPPSVSASEVLKRLRRLR